MEYTKGFDCRSGICCSYSLGVRALYIQCKKKKLENTPVIADNCLQFWLTGFDIVDEKLINKARTKALQSFQDVKRLPAFRELPMEFLERYLLDPVLTI